MHTLPWRHAEYMISGMQTVSRRTCRYAVCVALVLATVADAGPEIVKAGSLVADYDGPGPLIYLAFAVFVALAPWRYAPLVGVALSSMFIFGGLADPVFRDRLVTPGDWVDFVAGWLQILAFAAAVAFGLAAVWLRPKRYDTHLTRTGPTGSDS